MSSSDTPLHNFLFPKLNLRFFLRLASLALLTIVICRHVVTPAWTNGASMLPTYAEHQFLPIWRPAYWFRPPAPGDVVAVRYIGARSFFLKRVVATAGQTVEFRQGDLYVDGKLCTADWAHLTACDWEMPPRTVPPGEIYVIGDNRAVPMNTHIFGHVSLKRVSGAPLW